MHRSTESSQQELRAQLSTQSLPPRGSLPPACLHAACLRTACRQSPAVGDDKVAALIVTFCGHFHEKLKIVHHDHAARGRANVPQCRIVVSCSVTDTVAFGAHGQSRNDNQLDVAALRHRSALFRLQESLPSVGQLAHVRRQSKAGRIAAVGFPIHERVIQLLVEAPQFFVQGAQIDLPATVHGPEGSNPSRLLQLRQFHETLDDALAPFCQGRRWMAGSEREHSCSDLLFGPGSGFRQKLRIQRAVYHAAVLAA